MGNFLTKQTPVHLILVKKIQIFDISLFPQNPQNLMKSWKLLDFLEKYTILKHFT